MRSSRSRCRKRLGRPRAWFRPFRLRRTRVGAVRHERAAGALQCRACRRCAAGADGPRPSAAKRFGSTNAAAPPPAAAPPGPKRVHTVTIRADQPAGGDAAAAPAAPRARPRRRRGRRQRLAEASRFPSCPVNRARRPLQRRRGRTPRHQHRRPSQWRPQRRPPQPKRRRRPAAVIRCKSPPSAARPTPSRRSGRCRPNSPISSAAASRSCAGPTLAQKAPTTAPLSGRLPRPKRPPVCAAV